MKSGHETMIQKDYKSITTSNAKANRRQRLSPPNKSLNGHRHHSRRRRGARILRRRRRLQRPPRQPCFCLPLTIAAIFRASFLRYRFTNRRVTVVSGFTGQDRSDFPYSAIQDVQLVPRFIGEWGDLVITLRNGTKVDLPSVPKFREIADYCLFMSDGSKGSAEKMGGSSRGF